MKIFSILTCLLIFMHIPMHAQELDKNGALKLYPDKETTPTHPFIVEYGIHADFLSMPSGLGLLLGLQGGLVYTSGFTWGGTLSFLVNKGLQSTVYPNKSVGYGYGGFWLGYSILFSDYFRMTPRVNLALGGMTQSDTGTNSQVMSTQLSGAGLLIPELLLSWYFSPLLSAGVSLKYHYFLGDTTIPGLNLSDVTGFSLGIEFNFRTD